MLKRQLFFRLSKHSWRKPTKKMFGNRVKVSKDTYWSLALWNSATISNKTIWLTIEFSYDKNAFVAVQHFTQITF